MKKCIVIYYQYMLIMENLHKVLWEVYQESIGESDFLEKAEIILKPYYREVQKLEQNACI